MVANPPNARDPSPPNARDPSPPNARDPSPPNALGNRKPLVVVMDLEGCLLPEIWQAVAEKTNVPALRLTTRDIADYDVLMKKRIALLHEHNISFDWIQKHVLAQLRPLAGAKDFLDWLRSQVPVLILSDTYYQMVQPVLMKHLGFPTLFCHSLQIAADGMIQGYRLRHSDSKTQIVRNLMQDNGFSVIAIGDSHNDMGMLLQANQGIFLHAPKAILKQYPQIFSCSGYGSLKEKLEKLIEQPSAPEGARATSSR